MNEQEKFTTACRILDVNPAEICEHNHKKYKKPQRFISAVLVESDCMLNDVATVMNRRSNNIRKRIELHSDDMFTEPKYKKEYNTFKQQFQQEIGFN